MNITPDTPPTMIHEEKTEHPIRELLQFTLIALVIVLPIRFFIAQPFIVSGSSMYDTFKNGDYLIVDQVSYRFHEPARGDVVIFRYPNDPSKFFIKRIIGLPGETILIDGSTVTIKNAADPEGFTLTEPYVDSMSAANSVDKTLGPDDYFVMGDNRDYSSDSRAWGMLPRQNIVGHAFLRLFPINALSVWPGTYQTDNTAQ